MDLATYVTTDPKARGFSSMTAQQIADSIHARGAYTAHRDFRAPIQTIDVRRTLHVRGKLATIIDESENATDTTVRVACRQFVEALKDFEEGGFNYDPADASTPLTVSYAIKGALDALVSAGRLVSADKTAVLDLGADKLNAAEYYGWGEVNAARARAATRAT